MFAALAAAATLATPMGIHFWTAIVRSLGRIRLLGIDEWAAPRPLDPAMAPFWIAAIAFVSLVALRGRQLIRDRAALQAGHLTQCACALALLTPAVSAVRNVPPFLLAAVPAIAALAGFTAPGTGTIETSVAATTTAPRANVMLATVATAVALLVVVLSYTHPPLRLHWDPLPASSIAALDRCPGNLYNRYDEGGYLIWFAPEHPVFLDGRQDPYPPSLIEDQRRVERTGNYEDVFRRYGIGCAFVPADSIVASRLLDAGWRPLYDASPWKVLAR
jgi:hypothetical protein